MNLKGLKALLFDFFGTLATYELADEIPIRESHRSLVDAGFSLYYEDFKRAYLEAGRRWRRIQTERLEEVTNTVLLSDALESLGFEPPMDAQALERAVQAAFRPFSDSVKMVPGAVEVLSAASGMYRLGLVTNFTYAPVIHELMARFDVRRFFHAVTISHEVGFRKPHPRIFEEALRALQAESHQAVMVGNDPFEDMSGAKRMGMPFILLACSESSVRELEARGERPDHVIHSIQELKPLLGIQNAVKPSGD